MSGLPRKAGSLETLRFCCGRRRDPWPSGPPPFLAHQRVRLVALQGASGHSPCSGTVSTTLGSCEMQSGCRHRRGQVASAETQAHFAQKTFVQAYMTVEACETAWNFLSRHGSVGPWPAD
jgi:hypothetical protein